MSIQTAPPKTAEELYQSEVLARRRAFINQKVAMTERPAETEASATVAAIPAPAELKPETTSSAQAPSRFTTRTATRAKRNPRRKSKS